MRTWSVYKITCSVTGLQYIGCTVKTPHQRFKEHVKHASLKDKNNPMYEDMACFGAIVFSLEVLSTHASKENGLEAETSAILALNTLWPSGYNLFDNKRHHEISLRLMSVRHTGKPGIPHTEETKAKMRNRSAAQKQFLDTLHIDNIGKTRSEEAKKAQSASMKKAWSAKKDRKQSAEYVAKRMAGMAIARAKRLLEKQS